MYFPQWATGVAVSTSYEKGGQLLSSPCVSPIVSSTENDATVPYLSLKSGMSVLLAMCDALHTACTSSGVSPPIAQRGTTCNFANI